MAVRVVTDDRRSFWWRRLGRSVSGLGGTLLVAVGIGLTVVSCFLGTDASGGGGDNRPITSLPAWLFWSGIPVAIVLWIVGVRIARGRRRMVLFLRRFGYTQATQAASHATRSIGGSWRLVTLDDTQVVPVGVEGAAARAVQAKDRSERLDQWVRDTGMPRLSLLMVAALAGFALVCLITYLQNPHGDFWHNFAGLFSHRGPVTWLLFASFALFGLYGAVILIGGGIMLAMSVAMIFVVPFTTMAEEADKAKTQTIARSSQVESTARSIAKQARHIFSPRLVVVKVDGAVWQDSVLALADPATAAIVDISEPTDQVLWEIEALQQRHKPMVYVVDAQRVAPLTLPVVPAPEAAEQRLRALVEGRTVISYTTDRAGLRRFTRALRAHLEEAATVSLG